MEFRLAAEGNTDELRQWLRAHPERVNIPAQGSNTTLLYNAIQNANRTDLASLQSGYSRYLNTVRMLCEEYKADVLAPNGGNYNTALHLAASIGATDIVRYLVENLHTPVDCANVFGERAVQMAERGGFTECVAILQRAAAAAAAPLPAVNRDSVNSNTLGPITSGLQGSGNNSRFHSVTVTDSDDDDDTAAKRFGGANLPSGGDRSSRVSDTPMVQRQYSNNTFPSGASSTTGGVSGSGNGNAAAAAAAAVMPRPLYANPQAAVSVLPATQVPTSRGSLTAGPSSAASLNGEARAMRPGANLNAHNNNNNNNNSSISVSSGGAFHAQRSDGNASLSAHATVDSPLLPQPVRPRKEYDISKSRILANPDLQGFRSAYGDGFKYIQCSDHYEIRGILPYTYRGAVYYTPVIISVYAPANTNDSISTPTNGNGGTEGREAGSVASDPNTPLNAMGPQRSSIVTDAAATGTATEVYCRYRVCLNMQNLNDFAVSRKAEYIDPVSGAIIPAPGDDKYQTLTAYIRNVVVRNFESVPPLIVPTSSYAFPLRPNVSQLGAADNADPYRHHHSHNAPTFMRNALPARSAAHIRCAAILRDLSKFGDGLGRYFPENHRIVVYVPVFSERKAAVLAMPQERPYTTTVDQYSTPASPGGGANEPKNTTFPGSTNSTNNNNTNSGPKKAVTQQVAVEAVAELQVRVWMQFSPITGAGAHVAESTADGREGGVYAYPPRIFLIDAAARPPAALTGSAAPAPNSLAGPCFAALVRDRDTGEVNPERIKLSQESWSAKGSIYEILVELQKELRSALEAYAVRYTGRNPASAANAPQGGNAHGRSGGGGGAGAPTTLERSPAASPLDTFFTSPTTASQGALGTSPSLNTAGSLNVGSSVSLPPDTDGSGRCLYCFQPLQTRSLLQPCGHDGMCGLCVQRLQSHCREEVFACPVCRSSVRSVMEVFL